MPPSGAQGWGREWGTTAFKGQNHCPRVALSERGENMESNAFSRQRDAEGSSERGVRSDPGHGWEGGPCRTGRWPQPGAPHLPSPFSNRVS